MSWLERLGLTKKLKTQTMHDRRRQQVQALLKKKGISYFAQLPLLSARKFKLNKSAEEIARRAITTLFVVQVACDIMGDREEASRVFFQQKLEEYGLQAELNALERRILSGTYSQQDVLDMAWCYEAYWSLVWSLGLIDDLSDATTICDCELAIELVSKHSSVEAFLSACHLRSEEELLDQLELYHHYHWAVTEHRLRPEQTETSGLEASVVVERRRGLEWLFSDEADWHDIAMHT